MRILQILLFIFFSTAFISAQHTLSGRITNANGEPLIQASVFFISTYHAAVTDDDGRYEIKDIPANEYSFKVSYVGYSSYTEDIYIDKDMVIDIDLGKNVLEFESIEINAHRVSDQSAFAHTNLNSEQLAKENLGQDVPFLLRWTPSAVVTSDAGAGIGYTGIRLRGSDASRINVTINGVALNDSESQSVFWVNMPDFMSSVDNVQIQRGVGTSTNGAGAFGGTISLNTNKSYQNPYAHVNASVGSFNSRKLSVNLGTGLLNGKYSIDGRYSIIKSDGYIDRASSDLKSWYFAASKIGEKSSLKFTAFSGHERTYQSWYGTPEAVASGNEEELQAYYDRNAWSFSKADSINLFERGRRYNFYTYEDQVDDYQQDHYQLHYAVAPSDKLKFNATAHYTRGFGFFEESKRNEDYSDYRSITPISESGDSVTSGDIVRRRWLDNDYFGVLLSSEYAASENTVLQLGGAASLYKGDHFGNIVTAENVAFVDLAQKYYEGVGDKFDANAYLKINQKIGKFDLFGDLQVRNIDYTISGEDDDLTILDVERNYTFFNPKAGITYNIKDKHNVYASFAVANKEPTRSDFIDNLSGTLPDAETLYDTEIGYRLATERFSFEWNNYFMFYDNQLVPTGAVNNSGAFIKENVGKSSRIGAELSLTTKVIENLYWNINSTFSRNKIDEFTEVIEVGSNEDALKTTFTDSDISYSPSVIAANSLLYKLKNIEVELTTKFVGKQFLDNTSSDEKKLPAYTFTNLRLAYDWDPSFLGKVRVTGMVNNLFNSLFSSNGYTYSYAYKDMEQQVVKVTENFVYPQAGLNFMLGVNVEF